MGFLDKILNAVKLNDDYDDDDEFFDDDEDIEESKPKKRFFKKLDSDDDFDDDEPAKTPARSVKPAKETATRTAAATKTAPAKPKAVSKPKTSSKITPLSGGRTSMANMEVCVIKPSSMEDTREIADTLLDDCTVLLNLEGIDVEVAQRVIDFSSGACYSLGGSLQKVSSYIFVLTPANVEISGDFQEILNNNFNMPSFRTDF